MDFDWQELKECVKALKKMDFELAYLAVLTREVLKPLSRWEKPLHNHGLELLQQMGLLTKQIRRTVKTGKVVPETIFSVSPGYLKLYKQRFGDQPIDKSAAATRFEGFLFGFPPCCVDEYIRHSYVKNKLEFSQQQILFHWACKNCEVTPFILPMYLNTYNLVMGC
ncbi:MAG: hypothetical protein ACYS91_20800 [Planctomycetota bacterium]